MTVRIFSAPRAGRGWTAADRQDIEARLTAVEGCCRHEDLHSGLEDLHSGLEDLHSGLAELHSGLDELRLGLAELRGSRVTAELAQRLDALAGEVERLRRPAEDSAFPPTRDAPLWTVIRLPGKADASDSDEGNPDEGNPDEGDPDPGDSDEGDPDEGNSR